MAEEAPSCEGQPCSGEQVLFNPAFLGEDIELDLSRFERPGTVLPGTYRVELAVNGRSVGRMDVLFRLPDGEPDVAAARACFNSEQMLGFGLAERFVAIPQGSNAGGGACLFVEQWVSGALDLFDPAEQALSLSIPQAYMQRDPRGWVDPAQWDGGVTAATLDYSVNAYSTRSNGINNDNLYTGLHSGLNVADWRVRHFGNFSYSGTGENRGYQVISTYADRDVTPLRSQLRVGEHYTSGQLFEGFSLLGASVFSDDRMYPDSQRGFAPTIRGIAKSNAKVTIEQNGQTLYETTVQPGPFEINDLYPSSYSGDLAVIVTEADGSISRQNVPYSSVPQLLRPGFDRYSLSLGRYDAEGLDYQPLAGQVTYERGLNNFLTVQSGLQLSESYRSAAVGTAINTRWGALGLSMSHSQADISTLGALQGNTYSISFSKLVKPTDTYVSLAAYRYSTLDYLSLSQAVSLENSVLQGMTPSAGGSQKTRLELNVSQAMPAGWGSLYISGSSQSNWDNSNQTRYTAGYSTSWKSMQLGLTLQRSEISSPGGRQGQAQNQFSLYFSIPLGSSSRPSYFPPRLSVTHTHDNQGSSSETANLSGSVESGSGRYSSYSLSAGTQESRSGKNNSLSAGGSTMTQYGQLSASLGSSRNTSQASLSLSGKAVAYRGGVMFGHAMGESVGIVEAPGAKGARVNESIVGADGTAIVALQPYRHNTVQIDPTGLPVDVELLTTSQSVAPRSGAISVLRYKTRTGRTVLLDIQARGDMPFGADLLDEQGEKVGVVGQAGQALIQLSYNGELLPGGRERYRLMAKWGKKDQDRCSLNLELPVTPAPVDGLERVSLRCTR